MGVECVYAFDCLSVHMLFVGVNPEPDLSWVLTDKGLMRIAPLTTAADTAP